MRILEISFLNPYKPNAGGVESYIVKITNFLKENNKITIISSSTDKTMKYDNIIELYTGKIMRKFIYNVKLYFYIKKHRHEFDIIHINGDNGFFIPLIKNTKTVMSLHGSKLESTIVNIKHFKFRSVVSYITGMALGYMEIFACKRANKIISVSNHIKSYFSAHTRRNDIKFIPTCINKTDSISISETNKLRITEMKSKYTTVCLWTGTAPEKKGLGIAKNAVSNFDDVILFTSGYKDKNRAKNVINLGYIDRDLLLYLYQISDIFIFPSRYEGFSSALLEAISYGTIPISFKIPATEELITDSFDGFLLKDATQFEEKIKYLVNNSDKMEMMKKNASRTAKNFYCSKILPEIEGVFKELLNG
ncbi:glycosyltransferase family 4 protein [Ferroplasma acidiphilum]|uniref:glycosyltransferase family 4 protein n=1 Tax=Ferroplasma acidiphilum TaxID=74969 RepID=UPI0023F54332|nr:glycosyltransferase family 4 protein [Ferroplasma acidiphilum]